jgi:hypothetical protein
MFPIYRVAFVAMSMWLFAAAPACAQDKGNRGVVQEDPILRSTDQVQAADEDSLELPSDAERARDSKVQEDPLLSGLSDRASATTKPVPPKDAGDRPAEQAPASLPTDAAVERDPIVGEKNERKPAPKRTRGSDRDQQAQEEEQSDADRRLVPKPKDSSVQEDPLMRSVDPPA